MSKLQVLIVDDEWNMRNLLRIYLMKEGFQIKEASTGLEALSMVKKHSFDIILLDVMMPDMDGWQVCKAIRETETVPILMLTARTETKDKIHGLGIGADDYLTKPFDSEELLARMYSLIRRSTITQTSLPQQWVLEFPQMTIIPDAREVRIQEELIDFTPKEFDLLAVLAQSRQRAFSREELVERIWGYDYEGEVRVVDTHIKNIREKLQKAGMTYNPIQTVWGVGYKFYVSGEQE
ncbi:DNA-binding response regulator, OmpR family, contains REC and winged-helix (wHTH) domain [Paenibacillus sophorae]|uniref:DNA-binding response regulator, OmpR family, contains REC and winged-helix (WHTH) domain n=1 Tax=Paenibacillus sophorae TaxID=1333845 RepID=A0A1H8VG79_9BACL|nr:response regulator transcription factor [Paenibacillus sophorae]QWU15404.1 response regulator transcription factor [Paenibacillus sophorae]SEP14399.1 DNA-binding response regulator, OmpR family, contains REC and winged-helix (wHTH) domain [Paenibacillus sophorae]